LLNGPCRASPRADHAVQARHETALAVSCRPDQPVWPAQARRMRCLLLFADLPAPPSPRRPRRLASPSVDPRRRTEKGGADTSAGAQERKDLRANTSTARGEEELAALAATRRGQRRSRRRRRQCENGATPVAATVHAARGKGGGGIGTGEGEVGIRVLS
jgi:hypothetical protein